jgi:hypothetical protein
MYIQKKKIIKRTQIWYTETHLTILPLIANLTILPLVAIHPLHIVVISLATHQNGNASAIYLAALLH